MKKLRNALPAQAHGTCGNSGDVNVTITGNIGGTAFAQCQYTHSSMSASFYYEEKKVGQSSFHTIASASKSCSSCTQLSKIFSGLGCYHGATYRIRIVRTVSNHGTVTSTHDPSVLC
jgi:hypothetical protein